MIKLGPATGADTRSIMISSTTGKKASAPSGFAEKWDQGMRDEMIRAAHSKNTGDVWACKATQVVAE